VVIGRFIPGIKPVVSGVAGIMGMGAVRFAILNFLSAIAWAAVHLVPGLWTGLALTGLSAISKRLAIVIGVLIIAIVLAMWFAKVAIGSGCDTSHSFKCRCSIGQTVVVTGSATRLNG
jgi:undecaprenyl-diphosphatase